MSDAFKIQAEALAEGGADALLFETFSDVEEARLAVRAAKPTGLPIVVSFTFGSGKNKDRTMMGVNPETAARAMVDEGVDAIGAELRRGARILRPDLSAAERGIRFADLDQAERGHARLSRPAELSTDVARQRSRVIFLYLSSPGRRSSAVAAGRAPSSSAHW